jgi:putative membrane protein
VIEWRRSSLALATCVAVSCGAFARAHDANGNAPKLSSAWTDNIWLWLGLAGACVLFARGQRVLRRRLGAAPRQAGLHASCFGLAIAALVLALLSPLDGWSDGLFSAHMVQHELLMLIAAPLLVLARPLDAYFWALPSAARSGVLRTLRRPVFAAPFHWLTAPVPALLVHGLTRWLWHIPFLFEACLRSETLHGVQHASFFLTALAFWWALAQGGYGKLGYGVSVLFVFATALHTGALGALISLARAPWYDSYAQRAPGVGVDALADQRLAGLVMWILAGSVLTALALALFAAWLGEAQRRSLRTSLARMQHDEGGPR